jgi:hypothetical protein
VDEAPSGGDFGEERGGGGLGEQAFQLRGIAGPLVAERSDEPEAAGRERARAAGAAGMRAAGLWQTTGGEQRHQALAAAGGAGEAGPERDDEGDEAGREREAPGDEGGEGGQDEAEPAGEVGGVGLDREG